LFFVLHILNFLYLFRPIAYSNIKELCYPSSPVPSLRAFPTRSALDEGTIRKHTRQILHALLYLHTHHIAHHNLKCTNILVEEKGEGRILLSDYGGYHRKLYDYLQDVRASKNAHYYVGYAATTNSATDGASAQELARKDDVYHLALCIISMAGGDEGGSGELVPEHLSRAAKEFIHACLKRDAHERPEVATLLKHPFVTQPYAPLHHAHNNNAHAADTSPPSPSASSVASASTASSSFASSSQSHQPRASLLTSSDTSTASTIPIPTLARREIAKKDKSANALTSAFAAARSDDESSASSASATSSRDSAPIPSRYRQDFEELEVIGRGGFGIVVKAKNRLDGRYANFLYRF
jgi:serine/threonine protein kinase